MGKTMTLATVIVVGIALLFGMPGAVWTLAFSVPIGCVLWVVARLLGWT
jgi:hypothetical protein